MDANYLYQLQRTKIDAFIAQDPDASNFDVTFVIDGQKLYANKYQLESNSDVFKAMFAERWTSPEKPIVIESYKYEDFKKLVTFLYSGMCLLDDGNVLSMVDIAEFFNVELLKSACEEYLDEMALTPEFAIPVFLAVQRYRLKGVELTLMEYIAENFNDVVMSEEFMKLQEDGIKDFLHFMRSDVSQEYRFEASYYWAKNQASELSRWNQQKFIKKKLAGILPLFNFAQMNPAFLTSFIIGETSLFTSQELRKMIQSGYKNVIVRVTDYEGNTLKGQFLDKFNVYDAISGLAISGYHLMISYGRCSWTIHHQQPRSLAPKLFKKKNVPYYLFYDGYGNLGLAEQSRLTNQEYLIAEMFAENGKFDMARTCDISAEYL